MPRRRVELRGPSFVLGLFLAVVPCGVSADKSTHTYKDGETVVVWTDKVGPYNNPQETYKYDSLGLCELKGLDAAHLPEHEKVTEGDLSIGEALEGHEFYSSPRIKIQFNKPVGPTKVCDMPNLSAEHVEKLKNRVAENYWYQLYVDDLPIWAFVGEHSKFNVDLGRFSGILKNKTSLFAPAPTFPPHYSKNHMKARMYTHRTFTVFTNGNQVIEVDMEPSNLWPVYEGASLNFTYSTVFHQTNKPFTDRHQRYLDPKFFEHKVHWFSIVNSFMLCLFLCAVVAIILMKTLKRDFTRYSLSEADELESMDGGADDSGWKQVNGDVFRRPERLAVFASCHATGCHLACTILCVLVFAIFNSHYAERGATITSFVISYLCTVIVGGFEGGRVFRMYGGQQWKSAMVYQCLTMPTIVCITFAMINTTAIAYRSTLTVPFKTIALVTVLFIVLAVPLHMAGTLLGRRSAANSTFPCRVHHLKRPIPTKHWAFTPGMIATAGIVPFGCLFIEMYFILSAVWSHNKVYYVYGFMFAILLLLCLVLVCVSITCTYVLLSAEDYRWAWQSFQCCGATAGYVFLYTIYYYYNSTQMSGFLQWIYYFGTSLSFCIGLGLFCGSMGFIGASKFVFLIYGNIKAE